MKRPSWLDTWMAVADVIAQRSLCVRRQAGTVLVDRLDRVIATGYNGPPARMRSKFAGQLSEPCSEWCPRSQSGGSMSYDDCVAIHSEVNALMFADRSRLEHGAAYITSMPCLTDAKNLSNSGVDLVACRITEADVDRQPELSVQAMQNGGLEVLVLSDCR